MKTYESLRDVPEGVRVKDWAATWERQHGVWGVRYSAEGFLGDRWRAFPGDIEYADKMFGPFTEVD
ncbi:hypothetical protein [Nocardia abscessus]|uniref:hypothetical protein n=1 Tax=Nocardia abscessus TaxID=120957 RepID=UPI0024574119|nr:hypothetical protein [Nocardia abscessus]